MASRSFRLSMLSLAPIALAACAEPGPAVAQAPTGAPAIGLDLGSSSRAPRVAGLAGEGHGTHSPGANKRMAQSGPGQTQGSGTVNSVDASARKVNMNHGPIPTIGWPAMTMDFAVAPSVDLRAVQPGVRVNFTIEQGAGGMYVVQSIAPAGGGR